MEEIHPDYHGETVIAPEDVVRFAPGEITAEGEVTRCRERRMFYRDFTYPAQAVGAPGIDSLLIVLYRRGRTLMRRRAEAGWRDARIRPGMMSLLAAGQSSDWEWDKPISVSHLYLSQSLMADTAAAAFERDYGEFEAVNRLDADDRMLCALSSTIAGELVQPDAASRLLIDSLGQALSLHLLRAYHMNYGRPLRSAGPAGCLTPLQRHRVKEYIGSSLAKDIRLAAIAQAAGLNESIFLRCFRATFGTSPHQYVMRQRVDRAIDLIRTTTMPLAEIAHISGFSDQAHMNRVVKKICGCTPGAIRH